MWDSGQMFAKIKSVLGYLKPYKPSQIENDFIRLNEKTWRSGIAKFNDICIVEGHIECPASIIDKARIAKALDEANGVKPIVFIRGFYERGNNVAHIYRSFNINHFYMSWNGFFNPRIIVPALFQTIKTILTIKTGEQLLTVHYKGIHIGDLIYDTLIRFKPNSYTVGNVTKEHLRLIFRAYMTFNSNQYLIDKYKPKYLVTSHNVYAEFGLFPRQIRHSNGGVVFLKDIYAYKCYDTQTNITEHFLKIDKKKFEAKLQDIKYLSESEQYFSKRMSGNVDQIDVKNAFINKKTYTINDLALLFSGVDTNKKNVVVMSHAFSDAPHVGEGLLFNDYYDFLEKTLIELNKNQTINCFVKAHPSSYMWNEKGGVEALIEKNNLTNVYIFPSDLNTNSICKLADYIVTAKGTAGLEFSCMGIPAITAGKGYYYGFGIAIEPSSITEYYELLKSITSIKPLNEDIKKRALVLLYMVSENRYHSKILPLKHIMPDENYLHVYESKYSEVVEHIQQGETMKDEFYSMVLEDAVRCND
jgi:hypothetical protein